MALARDNKNKNELKGKPKVQDGKTSGNPGIRNGIILSLILVFTFSLFARSLSYHFVNYDDDFYILNNYLIKDFSFKGFKNIFTTPVIGMYNPLTFVVYAFIHRFGGINPQGYYLINILLHLVATIGAFRFVYKLTGRFESATIVALFFAIHPMHAVVVTWASETKTSLFSVFYFFALVNYINYVKNNYQVKYLVYAGILFIFSLLSKPSAVTLAPMLLLLDYYLNRKRDKKMFLEKIPFFTLSLFFGLLTLYTHTKAEDSLFEANNFSLINNLLISNYSLAFYLNKILAPFYLCGIYTYPKDAAWLPYKFYVSLLTIPFCLWLIYKSGNFRKEMIFGFLFFLISISVVLRIVPSGFFRASNVYTYMSYTGLFFIIGQLFTYVMDNKIPYSQTIKKYIFVFLGVLTMVYAIGAVERIKVWENDITFYNDIINKNPSFAIAYNSRGQARMKSGLTVEAIADYSKCIELDSTNAGAYLNRGTLYLDLHDMTSALRDLHTAIKLDSLLAEAYINIGIIRVNEGKKDEALANFDLAVKYKPSLAVAYQNRAHLKKSMRDYTGALNDINVAIHLDPDSKDILYEKDGILMAMGRSDEATLSGVNESNESNSKEAFISRGITKMDNAIDDAINDFSIAIAIDNKFSTAYYNRGLAYYRQQKYEAALQEQNNALQFDSLYAEAYLNRGLAEFYLGKYEESLADCNTALKNQPDLALGYRVRSMVKVVYEDYVGAMQDLDRSLALNPRMEDAYIDKAHILFIQGKFDLALSNLNKAIQINPENKGAYHNRAVIKMTLNDTLGAQQDEQMASDLPASNL